MRLYADGTYLVLVCSGGSYSARNDDKALGAICEPGYKNWCFKALIPVQMHNPLGMVFDIVAELFQELCKTAIAPGLSRGALGADAVSLNTPDYQPRLPSGS